MNNLKGVNKYLLITSLITIFSALVSYLFIGVLIPNFLRANGFDQLRIIFLFSVGYLSLSSTCFSICFLIKIRILSDIYLLGASSFIVRYFMFSLAWMAIGLFLGLVQGTLVGFMIENVIEGIVTCSLTTLVFSFFTSLVLGLKREL